jgi:hypothetical protein
MKYEVLIEELKLPCTPGYVQVRLKQRGYFRDKAAKIPSLQGPRTWATAHILWYKE